MIFEAQEPVGVAPGRSAALVVDDEPAVRHAVSAILRECGLPEVVEATGGNGALAILAERRVSLIVCDLDMAGMDGVQFIEKLAERQSREPLLLMSGTNEKVLRLVGDIATDHGLHVVGALHKPLLTRDLRRIVAGLGDKRVVSQAIAQRFSDEELDEALAQKQIEPFFQPLVRVSSGDLHGFEALARWRHPVLGVIGPASFIPHAERNGRISELTHHLFRSALIQLGRWSSASWRGAGARDLTLAVNISATFGEGAIEFPDFAAAAVEAEGLDPAQVVFELTEIQIASTAEIPQLLSRLRLKGFHLAIDDFGTGYSGLDRLRRLPFTELKIDRSFLSRATEDTEARAIVEAGLRLGRSLGLLTVAEGVERIEEWRLLEELGCDLAQGFWISPPIPADQVPDWARAWSQ